MSVILETSLGDITIDLYTDERPTCCKNFLKLCKIKYYNFALFHSVQANFIAQTGDPEGTGRGGESIFSKLFGEQARFFEMETKPRIKHTKLGTLSMVNNGNNMHGSQFFLTLGTNLDYLDGVHTVFGEVAEGFETVQKLNEAICDKKDHRPYQDIRIFHTVILEDPYDDPAGLSELIPAQSPKPTKEMLDSGRIGVDEEIDDTKGKTEEEVNNMLEKKEAKANAQLLEMVGDLPDVDVKPPDTVLFVCKLNPVTTDEDLEIIFSRFGNILSCEVIKDQKSGESLQYAFVEFEKPEECENAYFKMDNVLIDDRRIHVDFSQSVAKVKWKGKGKGVEYAKDKNDDGGQQQFVIKDQSWRRKDNKYDFVFDDESGKSSSKSKKKKKEKKKKKHKKKSHGSDSDSDSDDEERSKKQKDKKRRSRSRSPVHKSRRRSRSRSREHERKSDKSSSKRKDRSRDRH